MKKHTTGGDILKGLSRKRIGQNIESEKITSKGPDMGSNPNRSSVAKSHSLGGRNA